MRSNKVVTILNILFYIVHGVISNFLTAATCGIPDPDLAFKFGDMQMIMGYLPWQTRLTEFL